jgi:peptidoglycan hydrolase-like protein with peptidoglycan-binding domain
MADALASLPWPVLQQGSQGARVKTLQYMLRGSRDAWKSLAVDGVFGPLTEEIVRAYQGFTGLTVDGVAGPETWGSITGGKAVGSTVRSGDTGEFVKAAQNELDRHNYSVVVDGIFGDKTDASVRQFQNTVGLAVDGVVGPNTWRELITR